jgi:hypothetical protein
MIYWWVTTLGVFFGVWGLLEHWPAWAVAFQFAYAVFFAGLAYWRTK